MKRIAYINQGTVHPTLKARRALGTILGEYDASVAVESLSMRRAAASIAAHFDCLILYFHRKRDDLGLVKPLIDFVRNGGSLLAVHGAAASFKESEEYRELLGGRFLSHGSVKKFEVVPGADMLPFFSVEHGFEVKDERYRHEYDSRIIVQYQTQTAEGEEPVVWIHRPGTGKVCYCALGHRSRTFKVPSVRAILYNALDWLLGRELSDGGSVC